MAAAARPRDAHPVNPRQPDLAVVERPLRSPTDALEDLHRLHDVLVHRDVDIDVHLVTRAVADILDLMPRYVDEVATFLRSSSG